MARARGARAGGRGFGQGREGGARRRATLRGAALACGRRRRRRRGGLANWNWNGASRAACRRRRQWGCWVVVVVRLLARIGIGIRVRARRRHCRLLIESTVRRPLRSAASRRGRGQLRGRRRRRVLRKERAAEYGRLVLALVRRIGRRLGEVAVGLEHRHQGRGRAELVVRADGEIEGRGVERSGAVGPQLGPLTGTELAGWWQQAEVLARVAGRRFRLVAGGDGRHGVELVLIVVGRERVECLVLIRARLATGRWLGAEVRAHWLTGAVELVRGRLVRSQGGRGGQVTRAAQLGH